MISLEKERERKRKRETWKRYFILLHFWEFLQVVRKHKFLKFRNELNEYYEKESSAKTIIDISDWW